MVFLSACGGKENTSKTLTAELKNLGHSDAQLHTLSNSTAELDTIVVTGAIQEQKRGDFVNCIQSLSIPSKQEVACIVDPNDPLVANKQEFDSLVTIKTNNGVPDTPYTIVVPQQATPALTAQAINQRVNNQSAAHTLDTGNGFTGKKEFTITGDADFDKSCTDYTLQLKDVLTGNVTAAVATTAPDGGCNYPATVAAKTYDFILQDAEGKETPAFATITFTSPENSEILKGNIDITYTAGETQYTSALFKDNLFCGEIADCSTLILAHANGSITLREGQDYAIDQQNGRKIVFTSDQLGAINPIDLESGFSIALGDPANGGISETFAANTIEVNPVVNIQSIGNQTITEGEDISITVESADYGKDDSASLVVKDSNGAIVSTQAIANGDNTTLTFSFPTAGVFTIVKKVDDTQNGEVEITQTTISQITVETANIAPETNPDSATVT